MVRCWTSLLLLLLTGFLACGPAKGSLSGSAEEATPGPGAIILTRESAAAYLPGRLVLLRHQFTPAQQDHPPALEVELRSLVTSEPLTFELRSVFYDADGQATDTSLWAPMRIPPGGTVQFRAVGSRTWAARGELQLRNVEGMRTGS